jgi:tRNA(Ile)-lysidine synthase
MELYLHVKRTLDENEWNIADTCTVIAVSGGVDSIALLHILWRVKCRWGGEIVVAHVNHNRRGLESDEDERFVASLAANLGLPFYSHRLSLAQMDDLSSVNFHSAARQARYAFFVDVANQVGATYIATAHHADDHTESVLMQCFRGTGIEGLRGLARERDLSSVKLIRPVFSVYKSELQAYCAQHHLVFREDRSNQHTSYTRNALRHQLLPAIEHLFPGYQSALQRLSELAAQDHDYLETETKATFTTIVQSIGDRYRFSRERLLALHVALQRRLIKLLFNYLTSRTCVTSKTADSSVSDVTFEWIEEARATILHPRTPNARRFFARGIVLERQYDQITFSIESASSSRSDSEKSRSGQSRFKSQIIQEKIAVAQFRDLQSTIDWQAHDCAWFDADQVKFPLTIRHRQNGDRIQPYGQVGTKKIKNLMIDAKMPCAYREDVLLVCDRENRILWVAGLQRSAHALITEETKNVLKLQLFHMDE